MPARKIDTDRLLELHRQGLSTAEMAARFGVTVSAVQNSRRSLGIAAPNRAPRIDRAAIQQLHDEGLTAAQIAKQLGCSEDAALRIRKELGISPARPMTPERRARIQTMLNDGWSWLEIERTEGANWDTMRRHFPGTQWTREQIIEQSTITRHARQSIGAANYAAKAA